VLAHEDQPRGPPVGPPVDGVQRIGRELPVRPEEARRLVAREAQLLGADAGDRLVRHQPRELRGRLGPADHDDVHPDRDLLESSGERGAGLGRAAGLVEVVEHEHAARGHAREELAEPAAREAVQVAPVLVREEREPPGLLPA